MISEVTWRRLKSRAVTIFMWCVILITLFPVYQMVVTSTRMPADLLSDDFNLIPNYVTLSNYEIVINKGTFPVYFFNSTLIALAVTGLSISISSLGGYSLARLNYPGKSLIDKSVLFVYIIPPILLVIPIYVTLVKMGLLDSYISVILTHTLFVIPFGTWLMRGFFKSIPIEIEDAARVDGASRFTILTKVMIPIAVPGLSAVAIFSFVASWDEFLFSSLLLTSDAKKTIPIGIWSLVGTYGEVRWAEIMAATTLSAIPMFVFFLIFQRWMVRGLTAGAVK